MATRAYHRSQRPRKALAALIQGVLFLFLALILLLVGTFVFFAKDLPDPSRLDERFVVQSTKIYDRTGKIILYDIYGEEKRTIIPFEEIPEYVKQAAIAIEDQNFYHHPGIDIRAVIRATFQNLSGNSLQGGSTITQQFIKNSILSPERTFVRKIKEAILALELERQYSKDEILGFYLNQIAYGSNAYGIEAAAQTFFSKHARDLTVAEAALLAALPKAPTYYSPYGSHFDALLARKNLVLERMRNLGFLSPAEAEAARNEELNFGEARTAINAPHFVFYVRELLEERYGEEYLARAGLKITTTLDWELQRRLEEIVVRHAEQFTRFGVANAALVALDPKTGQILAMVGSKDYFAAPEPAGCRPGVNCTFEPNVNVTVRSRQPGSAIKPIVYATAFKKGYTDQTVVFDVPTEFSTACTAAGTPIFAGAQCYHPQNFDGRFRGPVTFRQALANSLNVPSVQVLYLAGLDESLNTARDFGITTLTDRSRFGLSLVLGGGEVKPLELTSAFGVFATEGERHPPAAILKIETAEGVVEEFKDAPTRVLERNIAREISSIISDNEARTLVFGPASPLAFIDRAVAVKTGTTDEFRDAWTIGYTPSLVVGVWVGNNNNTPSTQPGVTVAAPLWREAILAAIDELALANESFNPPEPREGNKPILNGQSVVNGEIHTTLHYLQKDDPLGPPPGERDPQYFNWEAAVQARLGPPAAPPPPNSSDSGG